MTFTITIFFACLLSSVAVACILLPLFTRLIIDLSNEKDKEQEPKETICVEHRSDYSLSCRALRSNRCGDGRCRYHCNLNCRCIHSVDYLADETIKKAMNTR